MAHEPYDAELRPAVPFSQAEREAVYRAIEERRDMRHFKGGTVADTVLQRLLWAAHHAPSVGYMQPWRFLRVRDRARRERLHQLIEQERQATARALGEREDAFMKLKVQGVLDAAEVLVVALADDRDKHVFGRRTMPQMDLASVACALQNMWLAARAEGLGMGWVSLFSPDAVRDEMSMPPGAQPVAILCLGPVPGYYSQPMLEQQQWARREALGQLVFDETWNQPSSLFATKVCEAL